MPEQFTLPKGLMNIVIIYYVIEYFSLIKLNDFLHLKKYFVDCFKETIYIKVSFFLIFSFSYKIRYHYQLKLHYIIYRKLM